MTNAKTQIGAYCPYFIILVLFLCSCKENKRKQSIREIVAEWTGKQILFPDAIPCQFLGMDTVCINPANQNYKILLYVDSTGCSACRLQLSAWKQLISEAEALFPGKVDFLIFYQPKERDVRELAYQLKQDDFQYPVFLDIDNQIDKANRFPSDPSFQCFLLDKDNNVATVEPMCVCVHCLAINATKRVSKKSLLFHA